MFRYGSTHRYSDSDVVILQDGTPPTLHEVRDESEVSDDDTENANSPDELIRALRVDETDAVDLTAKMQSVIDTRYYYVTIRRF